MTNMLYNLYMWTLNVLISMLTYICEQSKSISAWADSQASSLYHLLLAEEHYQYEKDFFATTQTCTCPYCTLKDGHLRMYVRGMLFAYIKAHQGHSVKGFYSTTHASDLDMYAAIEYMLSKGIIVGPSVDDVTTHEDMRYYTRSYMDSLCTASAVAKEHLTPGDLEGTHAETLCPICTPYPEKEN